MCCRIELVFQAWINVVDNNFRVCSYITGEWILWWFAICASGWQSVDPANACVNIFGADICVRHSIFHQFHRHLLSCIARNSIRHDGGSDMHLSVCHFTTEFDWNGSRSQFKWAARLSVPRECGTTAHSGEKMVHGTGCHHFARWRVAIWIDIHRNVFCVHIILGVQNLLRLRIHAVGIFHSNCCYRLRNNRLYLFPSERRRLSMAMDELFIGRINRNLRLRLFILLFFL